MPESNEIRVEEINVSLGTVRTEKVMDSADDPFLLDVDTLRKFSGQSAALKRKAGRLQKAHEGAGGARSKKEEGKNFYGNGYLMYDVILPPYNLEYLAKLNEISSAHYAAIKAKVANIVALGYDFVESPKTKARLEEIESDEDTKKFRRKLSRAKTELHRWLDSCNVHDEFVETLIKVWTDYEATGNGYLEIGRKINGEIGYIGHIPASSMRIRRERDGFVQIISEKTVFFRNFGSDNENPIGNDPRPNEVIHIKKYSPTGNFYGVPDIVAAQNEITGDEYAAKFNLDYFENKAVPRYVVIIKGGSLSSSGRKNILEFFETSLKGQNHRTLFVPLPADEDGKKTSFEMNPVESGTQDSSFVNFRKGNLYGILMAHRVPLTKVGMAEGVNLAVARDADKTFKGQVTRPEQAILERKLNKIISEITDIFTLKLNELALSDENTLSQMDERYLRWGVMVPNEVRARWGWSGLDDGDAPVGMMQQAQAKIDSANQQAAQANATRVATANRSSSASDSAGEARKPKGDGRAAA